MVAMDPAERFLRNGYLLWETRLSATVSPMRQAGYATRDMVSYVSFKTGKPACPQDFLSSPFDAHVTLRIVGSDDDCLPLTIGNDDEAESVDALVKSAFEEFVGFTQTAFSIGTLSRRLFSGSL